MLTWGIVTGTLFIGSFLIYLSGIDLTVSVSDLFVNLSNLLAAFVNGSLIGAFVGFMSGSVLWWLMRDVPMPFTEADMQVQQLRVHTRMIAIPIALSSLLVAAAYFISANGFIWALGYFTMLLLPTLIASLISMFAAHHYLLRLQGWSKQYDLRKAKDKYENFDMRSLLDKDDEADLAESDFETDQKSTLES
jgi:hypothetical protein